MAKDYGIALGQGMLEKLTKELDPRLLRKAVKGALRKEARRVKAQAVKRLKQSTFNGKKLSHSKEIAKTIRAKPLRNLDGFIVAANPHGKAGMHRNRRGQLKPIAFWVNVGTTDRKTRRKSLNRGSTQAMEYIDETRKAEMGSIARNLGQAYEEQIKKIVKKINRQ